MQQNQQSTPLVMDEPISIVLSGEDKELVLQALLRAKPDEDVRINANRKDQPKSTRRDRDFLRACGIATQGF